MFRVRGLVGKKNRVCHLSGWGVGITYCKAGLYKRELIQTKINLTKSIWGLVQMCSLLNQRKNDGIYTAITKGDGKQTNMRQITREPGKWSVTYSLFRLCPQSQIKQKKRNMQRKSDDIPGKGENDHQRRERKRRNPR